MNTTQEQIFLKQALKLARKGMGWTNPNPMVGAVIVKNGKIIGRGYHKKVGFSHAEIEAIKSSKESLKGSTLYITLEPCCHFGRTPPCVDEIIKAKITRVVCCTLDPNPKVSGKGVDILRKAGVDVSVGILQDQARLLNEPFFTFYEKNRPFIAIKFATSLDGKIATKTGDSKWITNEEARKYARSLREQYQAILVGINTVISDNPHLGVRIKGRKDPLRIILDPNLKIPLESQVCRDNNVLIVTSAQAYKERIRYFNKKSTSMLIFEGSRISPQQLLSKLKKLNVISVLVEGGGETLGTFVDKKLVDKIYGFYAPIIIGGKKGVDAIGGEGANTIQEGLYLENISYKMFGDNMLMIGYPKR